MGVKGNSIKPLKLCRKCGKNLCLSGYCSFCRDKDERAATIKAREEMDRKAFPIKSTLNLPQSAIMTNSIAKSSEPSSKEATFKFKMEAEFEDIKGGE